MDEASAARQRHVSRVVVRIRGAWLRPIYWASAVQDAPSLIARLMGRLALWRHSAASRLPARQRQVSSSERFSFAADKLDSRGALSRRQRERRPSQGTRGGTVGVGRAFAVDRACCGAYKRSRRYSCDSFVVGWLYSSR
jgi:hypothetical protein